MWLTKDEAYPDPQRISDEAERGTYVFFNHRVWEKVRVGYPDLAFHPFERHWLIETATGFRSTVPGFSACREGEWHYVIHVSVGEKRRRGGNQLYSYSRCC